MKYEKKTQEKRNTLRGSRKKYPRILRTKRKIYIPLCGIIRCAVSFGPDKIIFIISYRLGFLKQIKRTVRYLWTTAIPIFSITIFYFYFVLLLFLYR